MSEANNSDCSHRGQGKQPRIAPGELGDVTDVIFDFLSVRGLMKWRTTSPRECQRATKRLWELARRNCSSRINPKCWALPVDATGACAFAVYNKICIVCRTPWFGDLQSEHGIPAHPGCLLQCCITLSAAGRCVPMQHLVQTVPIFRKQCAKRKLKDCVWKERHPAVPPRMTLEYYKEEYADVIKAHLQYKADVAAESTKAPRAQAAAEARARRRRIFSNRREFVSAISPHFKSWAVVTRELPDFIHQPVSEGYNKATLRAQTFVQLRDKVPQCAWGAVFRSGNFQELAEACAATSHEHLRSLSKQKGLTLRNIHKYLSAAAPARAAAAAINAGIARSTPAMLQGAAVAERALMHQQQQPHMQQPPPRPPAGGGTGADAAHGVLDVSALQLQCSLRRLNQSALADAVATKIADKVEADLQQLPQGTQRTQALARFRSQRHMHSIAMAFLNEPMYSTAASFDGLSWQLAVKRAIGVEEQTAGCKLCEKSPGGTLHARLCQAPRVKAHDTIVHNSDYTPLLGSAGPPGSRRMDIVLPADAFPVTGYDDPTRHLPLMVDVTCFEAQVASRAAKTAADPERCCRDQEAAKLSQYSGHYDQNCYKLATLALGSFGSIGEQGRKLLEAVATEYASRMSVPGGARPKALKGIALARLRSALSAALHMAYSGRVMTHMAESRGGGHMEEDAGEDPEMPFGGGGV
ncbi:hypothetical protein JKP88DRAFT_219661 [Tribonema minus]|uniref:Uncharacterized protein n=1 Tax=Tribonema minus TaxID=303371 RepID=A0A835Z7B3_9STRA|nr:hypothetical protein JKP88DRAFT_219661 [Tribonema minus]